MSIVFHLTNCPAPPLLCIKISVCHLKASVLQDASLNLLVSPVVPCSLTCTDTVWQTCERIKTHSHTHTHTNWIRGRQKGYIDLSHGWDCKSLHPSSLSLCASSPPLFLHVYTLLSCTLLSLLLFSMTCFSLFQSSSLFFHFLPPSFSSSFFLPLYESW